jgi:hypothetical protein
VSSLRSTRSDIRDDLDRGGLRRARRLLGRPRAGMPRPSPHLLHAWLVAWWRYFGEDTSWPCKSRIGGTSSSAPCRSAFSTGTEVGVLTFLGAEQVTLADLLLADGRKGRRRPALAERALATKFDYADFHGLPGSSRLAKALGPSQLQLIVRAEAPVLELNGVDWETYYATRLSSKQRALHRRRIRQLAKLGTIETTVARTGEELAPALEKPSSCMRFAGRADRIAPTSEPRRASSSTGRRRRHRGARSAADRDPQARRPADRLRLQPRARGNDALLPARLRPRALPLLPGAREPVRRPGVRIRRGGDRGSSSSGGWSATRSSSPTARSRSTRDSGLRRASPARSWSPRG